MTHEKERIDAIRRMLGAEENTYVKISSGEIIRAWDIADGKGNVGIVEIEPETLLSCYAAVTLNKSLYSEENFEFRDFPLRPGDITEEFYGYIDKLTDYVEKTMQEAENVLEKYGKLSLTGKGHSEGNYRLGYLRRAEPEILDAADKVHEIAWYLNNRASAGLYMAHYIDHGGGKESDNFNLLDVFARDSKTDALHLTWLLTDVREHIAASEKRVLQTRSEKAKTEPCEEISQ